MRHAKFVLWCKESGLNLYYGDVNTLHNVLDVILYSQYFVGQNLQEMVDFLVDVWEQEGLYE